MYIGVHKLKHVNLLRILFKLDSLLHHECNIRGHVRATFLLSNEITSVLCLADSFVAVISIYTHLLYLYQNEYG